MLEHVEHYRETIRDMFRILKPGGHINPIGAYYLLHALLDANFSELTIDFDKKQSTSIFWLLLLYPFIRIFSAVTVSKETRKFKTIDEHNSKYVSYLNAVPMLLGRTIIVGARKPLGSAG